MNIWKFAGGVLTLLCLFNISIEVVSYLKQVELPYVKVFGKIELLSFLWPVELVNIALMV